MADHLPPAPEPTAVDYFTGLIKAGISGIPDWGSPAAEIFGMITAPILGKRREEWFEDLRTCLNDLMAKVDNLTVESLRNNEEFVSALAQATQAALRTRQAAKREAFRNAVLNVALAKAPAEDLQVMFLNLIDSFTATHLQALEFFQRRDRSYVGRFSDRVITDQAVWDLSERGLLSDTRPLVAQKRDSPSGLIHLHWDVTSLGGRFLEFIKTPEAMKV